MRGTGGEELRATSVKRDRPRRVQGHVRCRARNEFAPRVENVAARVCAEPDPRGQRRASRKRGWVARVDQQATETQRGRHGSRRASRSPRRSVALACLQCRSPERGGPSSCRPPLPPPVPTSEPSGPGTPATRSGRLRTPRTQRKHGACARLATATVRRAVLEFRRARRVPGTRHRS